MEKAHLSIIIPVYNVEPYLARCLDSVLVDNEFSGEVICVNDGSTDDSLNILQEYSKNYDNVHIITQSNYGLSVARNKGLDAASREYVFFIDSDDWIFKGELQKVLDRVNGEDVLYFNATRYFEDSHTFEPVSDITEMKDLSGAAYFASAEGQRRNMPLVCVCGALYKRSFLQENHLYNEPDIYHEDTYFMPQVLLRAKRVSCVNICLYAYRIRQGSTTTTVRRKHIEDMLYVSRGLYDIFQKEKDVVGSVFYHFVSSCYDTTILEAYDNNISLRGLWKFSDSQIMLRYAKDDFHQLIAKLTFLSTLLAYRYVKNQLPVLLRKFINRSL